MSDARIVDALRTPVGRHRGALSAVRPDDLAARVVERTGADPEAIDDVYFGCANGVGEDSRNVARVAALLAGLPDRVPGATVDRLCGSGMEAVPAAARAVRCGDVLVAGDAALGRLGRSPLARIVASATVGVDPAPVGLGPVPAVHTVLAFASQARACIRELGVDPERVNANGGAIALGHPLGSSGARLLVTLARELPRRRDRDGHATMCVGVGPGSAVVLESPEAAA